MAGPIQVVLNATNFHVDREKPQGGGPGSDFFKDNDEAFIQHRESMRSQLMSIAERLERDPRAQVGFGKVVLRRSMWAKTHRPTKALFQPDRTPLVGGADIGQMLVELTPETARQVAVEVASAEDHVRVRKNPKTNEDERVPSRRRSETGAIESITLWQSQDRRRFTTEHALAWFRDPRSGGAYLVELFERPLPESQWDTLTDTKRELFRSFRAGLLEIGSGLVAEGRTFGPSGRSWLLVKLDKSSEPPLVQLEPVEPAYVRSHTGTERDLNPQRHDALLGFLDHHPLVRRIRLQPRPRHAQTTQAGYGRPATIPSRAEGRSYPKVGVIDGGLGQPLAQWINGQWTLLAESHLDHKHGTFIGGLLVAGRSLNDQQAMIVEADGCELTDVALMPTESNPNAFAQYYPNGVLDFLDEVDASVAQLRRQYGVRVFNFSLNLQDQQADPDFYSAFAERLDRIADTTDSLFVISAGNLDGPNLRPEWPTDPVAALRTLAASRDDSLLIPAESIRSISVGAVNPDRQDGCVPYALANYSRRGPGLRTGVKPDFCHVGGVGRADPTLPTGLNSLDTAGTLCHGCGTSYAAPLVAKTLAALDHSIEGDVSRETLLALLVHHAALPKPLLAKPFSTLGRELVGFGMPAGVDSILEGADHQITLVFTGRLQEGKQLTFPFSWPEVLTKEDGHCRGFARLTLVTHPPLDYRYGAELVRVNVSARLQQATDEGKYTGRLHETYLPNSGDEAIYESELIEQGFKWSPVKTYCANMPKGVGKSSSWRLVVDYLTRASESLPATGVPFTVVLTISDPKKKEHVFNSMRQSLQSLGVQIADIRTAARVVARV